ncbi:tetratricopeptide repeat protein [Psychrobacter arenosus]|uniref:tetratricopeptide repeat protein n=1 Tax=Psychrobacter arenosus TaxID=256326 RepID=UPI001918C7DC|nr:tetratricopeptide repeat protein [Psychrobacter arenosus]
MLNTKIYQAVYVLAEELLEANNRKNQVRFAELYADLKAICIDNEGTEKDHPVQWEALADFTEDGDEALALYSKALEKATEINAKDYMSSIAYAMAELQVQMGQIKEAVENLKNAKISANKIEDKELKNEIHDLLVELTGEKPE